MEVREMASEEMKKARNDATEHAKMALMDDKTYKNYAGKKTEDGILKCPRCKSMKTEYIEVQTRSADEPTTKKCTCNACEYRWKFC
jgi:DNA-directed RNA polymerase subunit M/transcription elongation factor TFIIS